VHTTLHQPGSSPQVELWAFPLDIPTPRHEAAITTLLRQHLETRRGEGVLLDRAGRLVGVITTRSTFRAMIRDAERRVHAENPE